MKHIIILILALAFSAFSGNYRITVQNLDTENVDNTLVSFMEELKYFTENPLHWCSVEPTGEFVVMQNGPVYSKVRMQVAVTCDETIARQKFRELWFKYEKFITNNAQRVDEAIECMYPDYELTWGEAMNSYKFLKLGIRQSHGGTGSFSDKSLFFRVKINNDYISEPMRMDLPGSTMKIIPTSAIPDQISSDAWFIFVVPSKLIKNGEFDLNIKRQWHLAAHEKFISKTLY